MDNGVPPVSTEWNDTLLSVLSVKQRSQGGGHSHAVIHMVTTMRIMQAILLAAVAALASTDASSAREYRFCAYYGFMGEDGTNCGFDTFQQCLATVHGVGGTCRENPFFLFQEPRAEVRKKRRKPRN
jgi:hypothetical protein